MEGLDAKKVAADYLQQSRFAGTVAPDDAYRLAAPDFEIDAAQGLEFAPPTQAGARIDQFQQALVGLVVDREDLVKPSDGDRGFKGHQQTPSASDGTMHNRHT